MLLFWYFGEAIYFTTWMMLVYLGDHRLNNICICSLPILQLDHSEFGFDRAFHWDGLISLPWDHSDLILLFVSDGILFHDGPELSIHHFIWWIKVSFIILLCLCFHCIVLESSQHFSTLSVMTLSFFQVWGVLHWLHRPSNIVTILSLSSLCSSLAQHTLLHRACRVTLSLCWEYQSCGV